MLEASWKLHDMLEATRYAGVFKYICYRRRCGLELALFVFLVLSILYQKDTLTGFAKATKTCPDLSSCKAVLEAIKFAFLC